MPRGVQTSGTKKAKPAPVMLADKDALLEKFKDFPRIDILSRRFANPNDPGSLPILLKDEDPLACVNSDHQLRLRESDTKCRFCQKPARRWYVRWFNLAQEGRNAVMRAKGYVPVERTELQDVDDVADIYRPADGDTAVRRGDRGQEVLAKMPLLIYNALQQRRKEARQAILTSAKKRREARAEAAGQELGDEAGQRIYNGEIKEEYFRAGRTTLGEEAGLDEDDA